MKVSALDSFGQLIIGVTEAETPRVRIYAVVYTFLDINQGLKSGEHSVLCKSPRHAYDMFYAVPAHKSHIVKYVDIHGE